MSEPARQKPFALYFLPRALAASILAPLAVAIFSNNWSMGVFVRGFVNGFVYSNCIGLPLGYLLPFVTRRINKTGLRLNLVLSIVLVLSAVIGCFVGGAILVLLNLMSVRAFWGDYWVMVRMTATLALVFGLSSHVYESLVSQLRETKVQLKEKELEQERANKAALQARLSSLESRIHPHFLFNTLNSISSLIPKDPERAEEMVGKLADLLRTSLNTSNQSLVPLAAEIAITRDYLTIEQARFGDRLRYQFAIGEGTEEFPVPPMSLQSLVENAVKHGISAKEDGGVIEILAQREALGLHIEVRDTGPGFNLTSVEPGHGLDCLLLRLEALFGSAAHLGVNQHDGRCVVTLRLPQSVQAGAV
jgi:two-component system, LytTR family, sensor histidine kinase AlgZ